jgi:hypothetical protein
LYYYNSRRDADRVVSEYVGRGEMAFLSAQLDKIIRQQRAERRVGERAERENSDREEQELSAWYERVEAIANGAMLAAGLHKHRGQWRMRRNGGNPRYWREDSP